MDFFVKPLSLLYVQYKLVTNSEMFEPWERKIISKFDV